MKKIILSSFLLTVTSVASVSVAAKSYERIVAMSPDVADVIIQLGGASKVVGKNATNRRPELKHAKVVGVHRNITVESVLSVKPDLVVGSYMVQPQSIYQRLNSLNIKAVNVAPKEDVKTFTNSIREVGKLIGKSEQGKKLASTWAKGMKKKPANKMRYLLSYDGRIVAGKGTVGNTLIEMAGGINAGAVVNGLKPLSREAWLRAKPDVIIIAKHNIRIVGSKERFARRPEVAISPAGKNKNIRFWGANEFLRFGLNSPDVVNKLHKLSIVK